MADFGLARFINQGVQLLATRGAVAWFAVRSAAAPSANIIILTPTTPPAQNTDQIMIFNGNTAAGYQASFANVPSGGGGGGLSDVNITAPLPLQVSKTGTTTQNFTLSFVSTTPQNQVLASPDGATGAAAMRSLVTNDIPTLTTAKLSDFTTAVTAFRLDQFTAPTANVNINSQKLTGLADPTNLQDAATKNYVDAAITTGTNQGNARTASLSNVNIASPGATISGVTLSAGDLNKIVALFGQTNATENGLYLWNGAAVPMTRATSADTSAEVRPGMFIFVSEGTGVANNGWRLTTPDPIVLGTTALTFTQTSGAGQIDAGSGLTKTGNLINVIGTLNRILANSDSIDIDPNYVGQTSITTLGTIATGTWNGTAIAVARGGTGATTAKAARDNISAAGRSRGTFVNADLASGNLLITHNLDITGTNFAVLIAIIDNNGKTIGFPDDITPLTKDTAEVDLTFAGTIAGTWSWIAIG